MADDLVTVADHVADAYDLSGMEVSEIKNGAPLMALLPAIPSSNGANHKYSKYTQEPVVGFRGENDGRDFDHSVDTIVSEDLSILDWSWQVDKAVADAWRQGGAAAYVGREGNRHLAAALYKGEVQLINGTDAPGDAGGFTGWKQATASLGEMVISAGGASVDAQSSLYAIRVPEVAPVVNPEGGFSLGETVVINAVSGATAPNFPVYYTPACIWMASQVGGLYSIGRIANIENSLTDDMIADLISRFPAGSRPTHLVCNPGSQELLRASRTATNPTGAPAPFPDSVHGIPLVTTDAISNAEAVVA